MVQKTLALSFTGYRRSGKSSVSEIVAVKLGIERFCTDAIFEERHKMKIKTYVEVFGWVGFRAAESDVGREIYSGLKDRAIVDLGGGFLSNSESVFHRNLNVEMAKMSGQIVYLTPDEDAQVSAKILAQREVLANSDPSRPPLPQKTMDVVIARHPLYMAACDGFVVYESGKIGTEASVIHQKADEVIRRMNPLLRI
jgi:shikimate kinase